MSKKSSPSFSGLSINSRKSELHLVEEVPTEKLIRVKDLDVNLIDPNPNQPRKFFDQEKLEELAKSIKSKGVIQPVILKRVGGGRYQLVAGERRWRASKLAGRKTVPSITLSDDIDVEELSLIENIQRESLLPLEESVGIHNLINNREYRQNDVAFMIGKTQGYISQACKIAKFAQKYGYEKLITLKTRDGKPLSREALIKCAFVPFEDGKKLLEQIIKNNMNVREVRKKVDTQWNSKKMINHLRNVRKTLSFDHIESNQIKDDEKDLIKKELETTRDTLMKALQVLDEKLRGLLAHQKK